MKIYIVVYQKYYDISVDKVFKNKKDAEDYCEGAGLRFRIEEHELTE